ncbi:MAG: ACT domain-containing protein [Clostridia bacterium]|nr:ACT domain-containing protein [Clostridia bacterium]
MKSGVIGYLGPKGTYSQLAAEKLCAGAEIKAYPSFFTLFSALKNGEACGIVLPIENSLNGAVTQNLDLLQETENVYAKAAASVKIDHRLVTKKGCDKIRITRVYSHAQALGQCAKFLASNFPEAELHETASTADSLKKLECETDACIVGAHLNTDGFDMSANTISDEASNYTQFLLVVNGAPEESAESQKVFFSFTCRHRVGALVDMLSLLKESGINMTEIESRPIKSSAGEFRFFLEVEGDYSDGKIKAALNRVKEASSSFKLLGVY